MILINNSRKRALMFLSLLLCLSGVTKVHGQGKQAIIILRSPGTGASVSECEGTADLNYQIVNDLKLNNKDEIRLAGNLSAQSDSAVITRKAYEDSAKGKLKDLSMLGWGRNGVLSAVSVSGQAPIAVLPDNMKPQKEAAASLSSFYSVMLTGEARDGKQKRKINLALRDVWKIYFVPEGAATNDVLFRHAAEEKSVALWETFLKKTNNYRSSEANSYMRDALIACARTDLDAFLQGNYGALEKARQKTERAQSVKDDENTRQLLSSITQAKQKVDNLRAQVFQLISDTKFDEAITAAEPIKIYLDTWPDLNGMYKDALKGSHDRHLFKGQESLRGNQLDAALNDCTIAWRRVPESVEAHDCVCKSRNRVALRDSANLHQQHRLKDAKETLEKQLADSDCTRDEAVAKAFGEAKCEYAQQLLNEARQLIAIGGAIRSTPITTTRGLRRARGGVAAAAPPRVQNLPANVKSISAQNKKDFRDAREKLALGFELCQDEPIRTLLEAANRSLSSYCLEEARKAMQRGDYGTAYVYLQAAQDYTPGDGTVSNLLSEARDHFAQRTQVSVGVAFGDKSGGRYGSSVINEVSSEVESVAARAGLKQPVMLDREQAAGAARAIQGGKSLNGPTVVFFGELLAAEVRPGRNTRSVPATYQYYNPQRESEDRAIDEVKSNYNNCKKQSGEAGCTAYADQIARMRAHRDSLPRYLSENYNYRETTYQVGGNVRMSFRSTNSISRSLSAADVLEANVSQQCVQREGMRNSSGQYFDDPACNISDEESYISAMASKIKGEASLKAYAELSALPTSYYSRARSAVNRQQAIEDYLRFLFLTSDKGSAEVQETQRALVAYDPELKTDGVLR
jgi:hypothetical protein